MLNLKLRKLFRDYLIVLYIKVITYPRTRFPLLSNIQDGRQFLKGRLETTITSKLMLLEIEFGVNIHVFADKDANEMKICHLKLISNYRIKMAAKICRKVGKLASYLN